MAAPPLDAAGLDARRLAAAAIHEVLRRRAALDEELDRLSLAAALPARDEALARAIAVTAFRRHGTLRQALSARLDKGLPSNLRLLALLLAGAAQVLFLDVPDHAAVDLTVRLAQADRQLKALAGLVNAVLRRLARERDTILGQADPLDADTPSWLAERWTGAYGEDAARAVAAAHREGAPLDISVKADPEAWASRLGGLLLPTGSIRLSARTPVRELPGYEEGAWWIQDAAAALPARLLGPKPGERIADLCAAPGGKTAQLAAAGAGVFAVDRSAKRLERLSENMGRLGLNVETLAADAETLVVQVPFDAVLLDAPCSATGTIRRHPDVAWSKTAEDIARLAGLQTRLLASAATLLRPGGRLVYCTCSLEPEEGERQVERFLAERPDYVRAPVTAEEIGGIGEAVTPQGDLRTLPCQLPAQGEGRGGLDGFFASRLIRRA